jgi:uncharacterized protein YjiK
LLTRDSLVSTLRTISACLVAMASACAAADQVDIDPFVDNSKADGHHIKLHLVDHHKMDVDEPSDLAFSGGKLYAVSDQHSNVYEIDPDDGDPVNKLDIKGDDVEGLAFAPDGRMFVADESTAKIWQIDEDGNRHGDPIEVVDAEDGNSGLEGITFDDQGHLFVAKEKQPPKIYELDTDFGQLDKEKIDFAGDLSALAWDPTDGHLYALSDEDHSLFRLDHDLDVDKAWKLPIEHPEGIAFDGDTLYVCSDSESKLYVFQIDRQ